MKLEDEERIAANLVKIMAMISIRNTRLEDFARRGAAGDIERK